VTATPCADCGALPSGRGGSVGLHRPGCPATNTYANVVASIVARLIRCAEKVARGAADMADLERATTEASRALERRADPPPASVGDGRATTALIEQMTPADPPGGGYTSLTCGDTPVHIRSAFSLSPLHGEIFVHCLSLEHP
jgi:hypothetical protein